MTLDSVPWYPPLGPPPATYVMRSFNGPPWTYSLTTTVPVESFTVQITAPDGRSAQQVVP